jgi:hypothetical protein
MRKATIGTGEAGSVPMLRVLTGPVPFRLQWTEAFPSGIVSLRYAVVRGRA